MNLTTDQVLQLIGAKELDIQALKLRVVQLEKESKRRNEESGPAEFHPMEIGKNG